MPISLVFKALGWEKRKTKVLGYSYWGETIGTFSNIFNGGHFINFTIKRFKVAPYYWSMECDMLMGKVEVNEAREIKK